MNDKLQERSLRVWRAVAESGRNGVSRNELIEKFAGVIDSYPISVSLQSMRDGGYVVAQGTNRWTRWHVTPDCKLPVGEQSPAWLVELPDESQDRGPHAVPAEANTRPPAPMSVFNLAQNEGDRRERSMYADLSRQPSPEKLQRAQESTAATRRFEKCTGQPLSHLDWKAPPQAEDAIAPAGDDTSIELVSREHGESSSTSHRDPDFLCYLDSDGDLYIASDGEHLELPLPHVLKLFRYLDRLRGDSQVEDVLGVL